MAAPNEVLELVDRFERIREAYTSPGYNETEVRRELIDPLFKALGWDNHQLLPAYQQYENAVAAAYSLEPFLSESTRRWLWEQLNPMTDALDELNKAKTDEELNLTSKRVNRLRLLRDRLLPELFPRLQK